MSKNKSAFWKGAKEGFEDAKGMKISKIAGNAILPGTTPREKGSEYKKGYDWAREKAKEKK